MKNKYLTSILLLAYAAIQLSSCIQNLNAQVSAPGLPKSVDSLSQILTRKEAVQLLIVKP